MNNGHLQKLKYSKTTGLGSNVNLLAILRPLRRKDPGKHFQVSCGRSDH